ncbi:fibronectin type III domain-containing protein [Paenibacillus sp. SAF-054]
MLDGKSPSDPSNWEERRVNNTSSSPTPALTGIATDGKGTTVVTGQDGSILTSTNGWVNKPIPEIKKVYGVAYGGVGGTKEKFYLVGEYESNHNKIYSSEDGITWEVVAELPNGPFRNLAYGNGTLVAVGNSGYVYISDNATSWKAATLPNNVSGIHYPAVVFGNGKFYASGGVQTVISSTDGDNWEVETTNPGSNTFTSIEVAGGRAMVAAQGSVKSATVSPPVIGGPVSTFTDKARTSRTVSFEWTAASGSNAMKIEQKLKGAGTWGEAFAGNIDANATSATVTGLTPNTEYEFRLVVDGGVNAGSSNEITVKTDVELITSFAQSAVTDTTAGFTWTAAVGANSVKIEQKPKSGGSWTASTTGVLDAGASSATVTGLTPHTEYEFRLVVTGGENDGISNVISLKTPQPVNTFENTGVTNTTASFAWPTVTGATGIKIEASLKNSGNWVTVSTNAGPIPVTATSAIVTGLTPGQEYDFRLVVTGGDNAGNSNVVTAKTTLPVNDFMNGEVAATTAQFTWTPAVGASSVRIEQKTESEGNWTVATTSAALNPASASATVTGLTPNTEYEFRLVVTGGEKAGTSNVVTAKTKAAPIGTLVAGTVTSTTVQLNWPAATGASSVMIEQKPKSGDSWTAASAGTINASTTSATVSGLTPNTEYEFRLVVTGGPNEGTSNVAEAKTSAEPIMNFAKGTVTGTTADFTWNPAMGASSVRIEQMLKSGGSWTASVTGAIDAGASNATVTGLTPNTEYDFRLVVAGGTNEGTSNEVSVRTSSAPVNAFSVSSVTDTTASFEWPAVSGAVSLKIEQSPKGTDTWNDAQTGPIALTDTTATVTGLSPQTEYEFRLNVSGGANDGVSNTVEVTTYTYSINPISDKKLADLVLGYAPGSQETLSVPVMRTGSGKLINLSAAISGTNADAFEITQPSDTELNENMPETTFTVRANDHLTAGTYTADITITAENMTAVTFKVTQVVNLPNAPANPQDLAAVGGDRQVLLNWSTVTDATYYDIYMSTEPGVFGSQPVATATSATYSIDNLTNGTPYYFIVKAGNPGGISAASNEASATPGITPDAPQNVIAVAGDGQATITFMPPANDGGLPITGYEVTVSPGNKIVTGVSSPITIKGLTNGTSYIFTVKAINAAGSGAGAVSNAVTPAAPANGGDTGGNGSGNGSGSGSGNSNGNGSGSGGSPAHLQPNGVEVIVNGKPVNAGKITTGNRGSQKQVTLSVEEKLLQQYLKAEGKGAVVIVPVTTESDIYVAELNGQMVKNMELQQVTLVLRTNHASYTLPVHQINIDALAGKLGQKVQLGDIKIHLEISEPTADMIRTVNEAAVQGGFETVTPPLNFTVQAEFNGRTVEVTQYTNYVERHVILPDGMDPNRITTGVVVEPDGTVRHVPTKVTLESGKYYAQIHSLTNSTYSVVWHPVEYKDVANHWSKPSVNEMGSRMVINGVSEEMFLPDRDITRAEFAAIIIRGLGIKLEQGKAPFTDLNSSDWYYDTVYTASRQGLINGYEDGTFRPGDKITREQAMTILSKAMVITGLKAKLPQLPADERLASFADAASTSEWAIDSMADSVQAGIVSGRNGAQLAPKAFITRAEVAAIVQRLLQKSDLI